MKWRTLYCTVMGVNSAHSPLSPMSDWEPPIKKPPKTSFRFLFVPQKTSFNVKCLTNPTKLPGCQVCVLSWAYGKVVDEHISTFYILTDLWWRFSKVSMSSSRVSQGKKNTMFKCSQGMLWTLWLGASCRSVFFTS